MMASDRIVAVGLLTAADVALLGQGFRRLYPVPRDGDFGGCSTRSIRYCSKRRRK